MTSLNSYTIHPNDMDAESIGEKLAEYAAGVLNKREDECNGKGEWSVQEVNYYDGDGRAVGDICSASCRMIQHCVFFERY